MEQLGLVEIAGIGVVLAYAVWSIAFFQVIRPRIMRRVGRALAVDVEESHGVLDAGTYDAAESAPVTKGLAVGVIDFVVLMLALPGVLAIVSISAFLIGDSGAAYRWEGALMGTGAPIGGVSAPDLQRGQSLASVQVANVGEQDARVCRVTVADYQARNGYLTGASQFFDLASHETRAVTLPLKVATVAPGLHTFRVSLECGHRLKDRVSATIRIES
jgi:hypothetical protein